MPFYSRGAGDPAPAPCTLKPNSVVRVNLQKPLPQFNRHLLDTGQILLPDQSLVAGRERLIQFRRILTQQTFIQNLLELPHPQLLSRNRSQKEVGAVGGEGRFNPRRQLLKSLLV